MDSVTYEDGKVHLDRALVLNSYINLNDYIH